MLEGKKILPTKILIRKIEKGKQFTPSGLEIPSVAEEITSTGEVVLIGSGTPTVPMVVSVGNKVMYPPRAPQRVKTDEGDFFLLSIQDILLFW